ncbi:flagellar motor protein MotB [Nocardioides marmorisolisilvae]|uniref:Flagellar motor protein MotB n=1 Tax=Nocardioides marmorisolisilvae TaxID=1542737 RepID=A0A3N0DXC3_9ACTN|nr:flagellar motor protein MotB [Nocardioides marmorisolisilvae]RNL80249.1 flagellar motor protein MotB [Nocardioides marmorisolisilvae]
MSRRKRHEQHEEHENHERWLVTYADMVTLLMVLFIVMFAMSQVDQKKFNALKEGLAAGFGQSTSIQDGSSSILDQPGEAAAEPIAPSKFAVDVKQVQAATTSATSKAIAEHDQAQADLKYSEAKAEVDRLKELLKRLHAALAAHGLEDDVQATIDNRGLVLSMVSRHVVFEPNLATLTDRGRLLVDTLAPVLRDLPDPLEIDGHTNQAKGKPEFYASDWDLSAARAVTVLRHLNEVDHVPAGRLTASAFGHTKPLVDPSKPGSQEVNKRVDIVVLSSLPSDTRALIEDVLKKTPKGPGAQGGLS